MDKALVLKEFREGGQAIKEVSRFWGLLFLSNLSKIMKIEELNIGKAEGIIIDWAKNKPFITKVYLFGSRISGKSHKTGENFRPDSDLDVAIEFDPIGNDENALTTWTADAKKWKSELLNLLGFSREQDLHLEWYHPEETPRLREYLNAGNRIIYNP